MPHDSESETSTHSIISQYKDGWEDILELQRKLSFFKQRQSITRSHPDKQGLGSFPDGFNLGSTLQPTTPPAGSSSTVHVGSWISSVLPHLPTLQCTDKVILPKAHTNEEQDQVQYQIQTVQEQYAQNSEYEAFHYMDRVDLELRQLRDILQQEHLLSPLGPNIPFAGLAEVLMLTNFYLKGLLQALRERNIVYDPLSGQISGNVFPVQFDLNWEPQRE